MRSNLLRLRLVILLAKQLGREGKDLHEKLAPADKACDDKCIVAESKLLAEQGEEQAKKARMSERDRGDNAPEERLLVNPLKEKHIWLF